MKESSLSIRAQKIPDDQIDVLSDHSVDTIPDDLGGELDEGIIGLHPGSGRSRMIRWYIYLISGRYYA